MDFKHPFDADTVKLLRIPFSYFLMPVFFMALSQAQKPDYVKALIVFVILHLLVYPSSNGYNSYMDQDDSPIGGLKYPPKPTSNLFTATLIMDTLAVLCSFFINEEFVFAVSLYILASRAYSYKGIRLKKYAALGFVTVVLFQGFVTYTMVILGCTKLDFEDFYDSAHYMIAIASSFMVGGVYPLTQIYQHEADKKNGDETLSARLGYRGTFIFCSAMFAVASIILYLYFTLIDFVMFQVCLIPVVVYFVNWFLKVNQDVSNANFENTMKMNLIASSCMNICFLFLVIYKNFA